MYVKTRQIMKLDFGWNTYTIVRHMDAENPFWVYKKWTEYRDGRRFADHKNILGKGTNLTWCMTQIMGDIQNRPMAIVPADYLKELTDIKQKCVG